MEKVIFLVGFMGSGKSYWGKRLADVLGYRFIDLDEFIEAQEGASVSELFAQKGEAAFRELERYHLHQLPLENTPTVVATGGGAPCFFDNMDWMNRVGQTIWLNVPVKVLAARLWPARAKRPLLANLQFIDLENFIQEKLEAREPFYAQASRTIDWKEDSAAHLKLLKLS
jgi:shikimate kinase